MFRRLFTLEVSMLREQLDDLRLKVEGAEREVADTARELLAIGRHTYSRGIWNFRSPG